MSKIKYLKQKRKTLLNEPEENKLVRDGVGNRWVLSLFLWLPCRWNFNSVSVMKTPNKNNQRSQMTVNIEEHIGGLRFSTKTTVMG